MCPVEPEWCCLFEDDCPQQARPGHAAALHRAAGAPAVRSWADMNEPAEAGSKP